jgi:parvulin-like peptidyl-prolyl isomerase
MTSRFKTWSVFATLTVIMLGILVACDARPEPEIQSNTRPTTQAAQTNIALTDAPPTAGPSPTPTLTSTPYQTATPFPESDPDAVVATIGDREITLAEYQARVRYERWLPLYGLARNIDTIGTRILDLTLPENSNTVALLRTINEDPESFGAQVMNVILIEQVVLQEAARRDLEIIQTFYDGRIAARIGVQLGPNGVRPAGWDEAYDIFIADMELYTGMSEGQFLEIMRGLTFYEQLAEIIGDQAPIEDYQVGELPTAITVQDITLNSQEDALEAIELLDGGATLTSLERRFGVLGQSEDNRRVTRGTEGFPETVIDAIFDAEIGDVVGPFPITEGWYVAVVLEEELDILEPADIAQIEEDFYVDWINAQVDDPELVTTDELWRDFVPTDPLPQDVSPMMRSENFIVPTDPFLAQGITSTPIPISDFLDD